MKDAETDKEILTKLNWSVEGTEVGVKDGGGGVEGVFVCSISRSVRSCNIASISLAATRIDLTSISPCSADGERSASASRNITEHHGMSSPFVGSTCTILTCREVM